ncbi:hypothetical protein AgCh_013114 [Apium graveolens]
MKSGLFEITKLRAEHTCLLRTIELDHQKLSSSLIASTIKQQSIPVALDKNDPNYVDDEDEDKVVGHVEVAKVAEGSEGVARLDVNLQPR